MAEYEKSESGAPKPALQADESTYRATAFTAMPFGSEPLQFVYEQYIKSTLSECQVECVRGDDMFGSDVVMEDVLAGILNADLIIADLTGLNANVFYEVGLAHGIGKPVLLLAQSLDDVPFDLRHRRILIYDYSPPGVLAFASKLKEHIRSIIA